MSMKDPRRRRFLPLALTTAAAGVTTLALAVPQAQASAARPGADLAPAVHSAAVASLQHTGMRAQAAVNRLLAQVSGKRLAAQLTKTLGDHAAGSFLDNGGHAVIDVLDAAAAQRVRDAGAVPKLVRHSSAELAAVTSAFDRMAGVPNSAWGVDPKANQVELTISDAAPKTGAARLLAAARSFGDRVRVTHTSKPMTEQVYDGDEISTGQIICSAGFNVTKGGRNYVITAGHCTAGLPSWQGVGPSVDSSFPGTDYGLIENDSSSAPGAVDLYNGSAQPITSVGNATVGEQVCKSGRTTGLTCGTVSALGQTVDYGNGDVVHGLIETNVYSDHGDSGGALFDGSTALGTVSGGDSSTDFFQPVSAAMNAYGVSLA
ncbi:MAG: S1 family peptidase [Sciscionella sp.]